jgi:hypothetical protein
LGGDETGASIGQVVEMGSEPTTETGLLVEIEVKSYDANEFLAESVAMAQNATLAKVEVRNNGDEAVVVKKKLILEKDGVKIFQLDSASQGCFVTMGGVHYDLPENTRGVMDFDGVSAKKSIQVDVPVGYFDVPISRESFRKTPKFETNFNKCKAILAELIEKEAQPLKNKDLAFYVDNKTLECGDLFVFKPRYFVDPSIAMLLTNIACAGDYSHPQMERKGKILVCLVSNHYTHRRQQAERISGALADKQQKLFYMSNEDAERFVDTAAKKNVSHNFVFAKIGSCFPAPKRAAGSAATSQEKYRVRVSGYHSPFWMNALELHNRIFDSNCQTEDEVKAEIAEKKKSIDSMADLKLCAVYVGFGMADYKFTAKALANSLLSLGYIDQTSGEYNDLKEKIAEITRQRGEVSSKARTILGDLHPFISAKSRRRIERLIYSKTDRSTTVFRRLSQMQGVVEEARAQADKQNEIASLFFKYAKGSHYFEPSRRDMRKVLKTVFSA